MTTISYGSMGAPPVIPSDSSGYDTINAFNALADNVSWQLYSSALSERNIAQFATLHYNKYYYYPNFDLRESYDLDGYILRGYATMNADMQLGGYIYLCVEKPTGGWSCASTKDTPAVAALPAS